MEPEEVPAEEEVVPFKKNWVLFLGIVIIGFLLLSQSFVDFEVKLYPPKKSYLNEIVEVEISSISFALPTKIFRGKKIEEIHKDRKIDLFIEVEKRTELLILSIIPLKFLRFEIPYREDFTDANSNKFPDILELNEEDSRNFRKWFLEIAKSQFARKSNSWKDRDCSGLIRFAYKEALKKHDKKWEKEIGFFHSSADQKMDVKKYNYPNIPLVGVNIFKISDTKFGVFADAYHLLKYNVDFISKDYKDAKPGDILFFYHPLSLDMPYHSMIYTGDGVLYHTGPIEDEEGELRYMKLEDVLNHFPLDWKPLSINSKFLGFFRFKILSD